jgi:drug/metabolite transporter (DMT)-like permease
VGIVSLGVLAFAFYGVLSRKSAKDGQVGMLQMTAIPLGFGGSLLLVVGLFSEGLFSPSVSGMAIVLLLAIINTVFGYLFYYRSLRILTALELHILLNLSPLGTVLLAGLLLGERLRLTQIIGIFIVILGVTLVQWRRREIQA